MRKVFQAEGLVNGNQLRAIVRWNKEWGEYVVQFFINGVHQKGANYHDPDVFDAINTARFFVQKGN